METPILIFDGWCVLCNRAVRVLLKYERQPLFRFASLDSDAGRRYRAKISGSETIDSILVVTADQKSVLVRGAALMYILKYMKWPWPWLRIFQFLPGQYLDGIYDWIARKRYRIWGSYDACEIPDEITRERLLEF